MNLKRRMLIACWIAFLSPAVRGGESVLYSITDQSVAYPATNRPVKASIAEYKTEIFAVNPETGSKRLAFSDANAGFLLLPGGALKGGIVAAGASIFAVAADRQAWANEHHEPDAVYQLSTDGSGKARRIFDLEGEAGARRNFSHLFVNPSGSKIGHLNYLSGKTYLLIHDTATGKLLRKIALRYGSEERTGWRFGSVEEIGWMPDGKRIFFAIGMSGDTDDAFWTAPSSPIGTYVMNEDADTAERLAPEAALHPKGPGMQADANAGAALIGVLPNGQYLFSDHENASAAGHNQTRLYALDLAKKTQKIFPLQAEGDPGSFHLSLSGKMLASTFTQKKQANLIAPSSVSVWTLELESDKPLKLLSFPAHDETPDGSWMNLIGWLEDQ